MNLLFGVLCTALLLYTIVLIIHVVLSWVPSPPEPVLPLARGVRALTDPLLVPLRRVIPPLQLGGVALDLSIIVLFVGVWLLSALIC